jgi:hypothetical protein
MRPCAPNRVTVGADPERGRSVAPPDSSGCAIREKLLGAIHVPLCDHSESSAGLENREVGGVAQPA